MKNAFYIGMLALTVSCNQKDAAPGEPAFGQQEEKAAQEEGSSEIVIQPFYDDKGQLMATAELPANWRLNNKKGGPSILGPGGISVYDFLMRNFMITNDPYLRQSYAQNGGQLRVYTSAADIVKQDLLPVAQREGSKLISVTDLPMVANVDKSISDMMFKVGPMNSRYEAALSEWEDKKGNPYAIIVHVNGTDLGNSVMWSYSCQGLNAPKDRYESAKQTLVTALESMKYNPRYFDAYNQSEQNKASASWAAHHQRMQAQQRQFDAGQAAHKEKWQAINESSMAAYNSANAASDRNHNRFLNYIKGQETVRNNEGNRYQVESGSGQYYMNGDGQYIGTNDPNYDPNRDPNVNNQTWEETKTTD